MNIITKQVQIAYYSILSTSIKSITYVENGLKWIIALYDLYGPDMTPAARRYCKMSVEYLYASLHDLIELNGYDYSGNVSEFIKLLRTSKLGKMMYRDPDYRYIILGGMKGVDYNARD